jgi:hypothetical protein
MAFQGDQGHRPPMARRLLQGLSRGGEKQAMTKRQADARARKLGLSAWVTEAIAVGRVSRTVSIYCVGFASLGMAIAEAESWEEAFHTLDQIIH